MRFPVRAMLAIMILGCASAALAKEPDAGAPTRGDEDSAPKAKPEDKHPRLVKPKGDREDNEQRTTATSIASKPSSPRKKRRRSRRRARCRSPGKEARSARKPVRTRGTRYPPSRAPRPLPKRSPRLPPTERCRCGLAPFASRWARPTTGSGLASPHRWSSSTINCSPARGFRKTRTRPSSFAESERPCRAPSSTAGFEPVFRST